MYMCEIILVFFCSQNFGFPFFTDDYFTRSFFFFILIFFCTSFDFDQVRQQLWNQVLRNSSPFLLLRVRQQGKMRERENVVTQRLYIHKKQYIVAVTIRNITLNNRMFISRRLVLGSKQIKWCRKICRGCSTETRGFDFQLESILLNGNNFCEHTHIQTHTHTHTLFPRTKEYNLVTDWRYKRHTEKTCERIYTQMDDRMLRSKGKQIMRDPRIKVVTISQSSIECFFFFFFNKLLHDICSSEGTRSR